jgi:acetylornithine deacetylase/succinyl-diaminopimelate desuccinylase-like protein
MVLDITEVKERILKHYDEKSALKLVKQLVETPSVTGNENEIAKILHDFLKERGFIAELQDIGNNSLQTIGRIKGEGTGRSIMLCGHLDIFPPPADMKNPYKAEIIDNKIFGAGVGDMKAGTAAMIMAADAILHADIGLGGDLILAAVREEEIGGIGILHLLKSGSTAHMGIVPESTNLEISTTGAGIAQFTISTLGKSVHIGNKEYGLDAISKMSKVICELPNIELTYEFDPRVPNLPRFVAGTIIGGRGRNYDMRGAQNLSDLCSLIVDFRFWKSQNVNTIKRDLTSFLEKIASKDPDFNYELAEVPSPFGNRRVNRNPKDLPRDSEIVKIVQENHAYVTGESAKFRETASYTGNDDGVHMIEAGIPTVTYGPGPGTRDIELYLKSPMAQRWIDVTTYHTSAKVMALSSLDVCR